MPQGRSSPQQVNFVPHHFQTLNSIPHTTLSYPLPRMLAHSMTDNSSCNLLSAFHVPSTVLSALHTLSHLKLTTL